MKNFTTSLWISLLVLMGSARLSAQVPEFLLYDETFTWTENTGGDGCQGYHFWTGLGGGSYVNWKSPYDFQNGQFYFRYEILDQPELPGGGYQSFGLSFCIWADNNGSTWKETCSSLHFLYGPGSAVTFDESPTYWWDHPNGDIDWTNLSKLWRFGNPFWYNSQYLMAYPSYCDPTGPPSHWDERNKFFPLTIRLSVVAVAQGQTFSGWDYHINGGGVNRMPTPTYTIDYINERTTQTVPSSDEYSTNSGMSGASSGSGTYVSLTPGTDMYFRTKASGEFLASYIQHLDVPSRPSAPTFTYDAANQRTFTTVSSDYEYSDSPSMSGALNGSGNYVSIPSGTTKYFRKKATASALKSQVQTLQGSSFPSIGPEFIIIIDTLDWPNSTDDNGFYFFYHNSSMPVNWLTPYDYYNGQIYTRYEIISQASSAQLGLQFGIWQRLPPGSTNEADLHESMDDIRTLNGPGSVVTNNKSPANYWTYHGGADYTQMNNVWHFGINPWQITPSELQIRQENASVWNSRFTHWYPMRVYVIIVAVAQGYTFSGWDNYVNTSKPATPDYAIDFANELTDKAVPSTDEYSVNSNMSGATSGGGQKIALTPGQTVYFRTKAANGAPASDIQQVVVPARPATPLFAIDYVLESTSTNVSSEYEHSAQSNMASATAGTGAKVILTPGGNKYFRKKATASAFRSGIQTLVVPARPLIESTVTDTLRDPLFLATVTFPGGIDGFTTEELIGQNCTVTSVGAMIFKIEPILAGPLTLRIDANATTAGNFASSIFSVYYKAGASGINPLSLSRNLYMYPTPTKDFLNLVTGDDFLPLQIKILDLYGNVHFSGELNSVSDRIDVSGLPSGMYLVSFQKAGIAGITRKIVKQ